MISLHAYKTLLWDWNGTIIDDVTICYEVFCEQREAFGLKEMDLEHYRYHFSFPVIDFYRYAGFTGSEDEYGALASMFIRRYNERRMEAPLQPGVLALLTKMKKAGLHSYVLSAYESNSLKDMVTRLEMDHYFERVTGLEGVHAGSKVEAGSQLMKQFAIDSSTALYIGDTVHDYDVAQALGVDSLLISSGHNSRKKLDECCADAVIIDSFFELDI